MQLISGYLYSQNINVVKNNDFIPHQENQLFYAKPLQIYKGVDNRFQFLIKNNEQKPVSLLDSIAVFNLIDPTSKELVFSRILDIIYSSNGVATTVIEGTLLNDISSGLYNYSILITNPEGEQEIVYSDDNYNAQGQARISENVYPAFVPSANVTILNYQNNSDTLYANVAYTSSTNTADRVKSRAVYQTVQYNSNNFVGSLECLASQDISSVTNPNSWVSIANVSINGSINSYFSFQGKFNAIKFKLTKLNNGSMNYILFRP